MNKDGVYCSDSVIVKAITQEVYIQAGFKTSVLVF
jgi:hypothetical protein